MAALTALVSSMAGAAGPQPFPWPPQKRDPLPPFPPLTQTQGNALVWSQQPYKTALPPWAGEKPSRNRIRANFFTSRIPGLPWKRGMGGQPGQPAGPICMDLDIFKFRGDQASIDRIFARKVATGITHFQFSLGHSQWAPDFEDGIPWSIAEVVALIQRWRTHFGGYADMWWIGGGPFEVSPWNQRDKDWAYYQPLFQPWIDALKAVNAFDLTCAGWQLNSGNSPMGLMSIIIGLRAAVGSDPLFGLHWQNDADAWWDDETCRVYEICERFSFWRYMKDHGLANVDYHQYDVNDPIACINAGGGRDGSQPHTENLIRAMPPGILEIPAEYHGQNEFDDPIRYPEWSGLMIGRLLMSADWEGRHPDGYGGGACDLDGTVL